MLNNIMGIATALWITCFMSMVIQIIQVSIVFASRHVEYVFEIKKIRYPEMMRLSINNQMNRILQCKK